MDTNQVLLGSAKDPCKKNKPRLPIVEQLSCGVATSLGESPGPSVPLSSSAQKQQPHHNRTKSNQASSEICSESPEGSSSKRKRTRKKKSKKETPHENENHKQAKDGPEADAVAISTSFLPVVHKAIHLLQTSDEHMSDQKRANNQTSSSKKASKKLHRKKETSNFCGEVEKVLSPGAQRLSLELSITDPLQEQSGRQKADDLKVYNSTVLNSQDLDLLQSASSLGPIYSRPSQCSSVTVTSSSSSNQLSRERVQSIHLFGSSSQSRICATSAATAPHTSDKMSAPQAVQKSREEVEAERKARKAAKAAAKGKGKPTVPESFKTVDDNGKATVVVNKIEGAFKAEPKVASELENMTDCLTSLNLSGSKNKSPKERAVDEPDLAISSSHFHPIVKEVLPTEAAKKSNAELRAERRAKQEAQRAAKAKQQLEKSKSQQLPQQQKSQPTDKLEKVLTADDKHQAKVSTTTKPVKEVKDSKAERRVKLFSHLYQNSFKKISETIGVSHPQYHSSIVRLGVQYASRLVLGSNARCLALLYALKEVVKDYETPPQKEFSRGLEAYLQPNMDLLQQCRPHSVSMVNALRYIKWQITQLPIGDSDEKAKQHILDAIDQYIDDQIGKAAEAIGKVVKDKIDDNDVILVYACSSLVLSALKVALDEKRKFHVIVVDSLPWLEGREMLRRLVDMGVQCSYVHLSAASFVMRQVSKILLGAHALLANGYVMSRAGSSQIALMAHAYNVPVLVCCETHKFSERVQTDSFVYNELGNPDELIRSKRICEREAERESSLVNWRDIPSLSLLNLVYDVTPPDLVTAVVTERAILPCTSVPVILRMKPTEC